MVLMLLRTKWLRRHISFALCYGATVLLFYCATVLPCYGATVNAGAPEITIVHPREGAQIPAIRRTFVYGSVTPGARLTINKKEVSVYPNGAYMAMVDLKPGRFAIVCQAVNAHGRTTARRRVRVAFPERPPSKHGAVIVKTSIYPAKDIALLPGEALDVSCQGTPDAIVLFSIKGVKNNILLKETGWGIYKGTYTVQSGDKAVKTFIAISLMNKNGRKKHMVAPGRFSVIRSTSPMVARVKSESVLPRRANGDIKSPIFPKGSHVAIAGKYGKAYKIRLSDTDFGWLDDNELDFGMLNINPALPLVSDTKFSETTDSVLAKISLNAVVPYKIEQVFIATGPVSYQVFLYGVAVSTSVVSPLPMGQEAKHSRALVQEAKHSRALVEGGGEGKRRFLAGKSGYNTVTDISWHRISDKVYMLNMATALKSAWGYDARYEGEKGGGEGNTVLTFEIRKPPRLSNNPKSPLKGLTVAIDAGHSPGPGAIGPLGTQEKDINLAIAQCLKKKIEGEGGKTLMTRIGDEPVELYDRPKLAWEARANIFVSVHANALSYWQNPFEKNGYSVYYFNQRQSFPLAQAIHNRYKQLLSLRDDGLSFGDFAVCRMTQMPSVLTESAYIIHPEQEAILLTPEFQCLCAEAMVQGIKDFLDVVIPAGR